MARADFKTNLRDAGNRLFHVTGRAIDDLLPFGNAAEKLLLLDCFERHLAPQPILDAKRRPYRKLFDEAELLSFAILDNHFHLVINQLVAGGLDRFMRSVLTGFSKQFNHKYFRSGPLFESSFNARWIQDGRHAKRAIAYVHLNHEVQRLQYPYTSHPVYVGDRSSNWLSTNVGLDLFGGRDGYLEYIDIYGPRILEEKASRRAAKPQPAVVRTVPRGRSDHNLM